jgi:two-component system sensor histidine kinase ChvG
LRRFTAWVIATAQRERRAAFKRAGRPQTRPGISPITWRILAVNLLALVFLFAGMLYLDEYRRGLINANLATLQSEATLFAAALGESTTTDTPTGASLVQPLAQQLLRRLVEASGVRARLFAEDGSLLADSRLLLGPDGVVQIEELAPPPTGRQRIRDILIFYDRLTGQLWRPDPLPMYVEKAVQSADDYDEVERALAGDSKWMVRAERSRQLVLSVAVPVQRYKQVLGALMLTRGTTDIEAAILKVRIDVLKWFLVALAVTVLLSLYLAGTIARPLRRLAAAAERVRRDRKRRHTIPEFPKRRDEIGLLAVALKEMTDALWQRMDAIERFAADVAHEIKNPLTSMRSAVETAARIKDPERRERLMQIIQDDVGRLDRLISDISDASRLDAELSRAKSSPVDIGRMFSTLIEVTQTSGAHAHTRFKLDVDRSSDLVINGIEGRLVQVFRNLLANAISFSPPEGTITMRACRDNGLVVAEVLDEGPGIPEGREIDIFQRFYSERPQTERFGVHSGLGLSISKQIVEAHGGRVFAENRRSTDGSVLGARFVVQLPTD